MKNRSLALLAALSLALPVLASCGDGLSVDFWDEREFDVDLPAGGQNAISDAKVVDLSEHAEVKDRLKQLKSLTVPEIWLEVSKVDATNKATRASGKLEVSENVDGAARTLVADYKDLAIGEGGKTQLPLDRPTQKIVEDLALTKSSFKAFYSGSLDQLPAKFHVKARIHVVATVGL